MDTDPKDQTWAPVLIPTDVRGLQDLCKWLNFMDAVLTTHNLTTGIYTEWNVIMRKAWETSPFVYAVLKWWLFWLGLRLLERSLLGNSVVDAKNTERDLLRMILGAFSVILMWHVWLILHFPH